MHPTFPAVREHQMHPFYIRQFPPRHLQARGVNQYAPHATKVKNHATKKGILINTGIHVDTIYFKQKFIRCRVLP